MAVAESSSRSLEFTPTWALATVTTMFVVVSFVVERSIHSLGNCLQRRKRKSMHHALQKMKDELMLVGFISLTLVILQEPISKICIKSSFYQQWSPCKMDSNTATDQMEEDEQQHERKGRRLLAAATTFKCPEGHEPFVSYESLHQLHIFIFILAANHVFYTLITMALALLKVYTWKKWEKEAQESTSPESMAELVINNISYTRQSTFMKYHTSKPWSKSHFFVWVVCFFQQFHIPRADYLTLRFSFITTHNLPLQYNFHDYMTRSMEDEFETIVGISAWLWVFVITSMLFSIQGINFYFWSSFIPILAIVIIGTKLQHIVATLAMESTGALPFPGPFTGAQLKPRDELFWFNKPKILLYVIHLVLFQDAFEMSTFLWQVWQFGFALACWRKIRGLHTPSFPWMGSTYKKAVVPQKVKHALHVWYKDTKKRLRQGDKEPSKDLNNKGQQPSKYGNIVLSSPMTKDMEEGLKNRETKATDLFKDSQTSHPSAALVAQNVWEHRMHHSQAHGSKSLNPIQRVVNVRSELQSGAFLSRSPGSELRRRMSPGGVPSLPQLRTPTSLNTRKQCPGNTGS